MSTEEATSLPTATAAENSTSPPEEKKLICATCHETIENDETKLVCSNVRCGKAACHHCLTTMIQLLFAQPELKFPLRCSSCSREFPLTEVDMILADPEQYQKYIACVLPLFWNEDCLNKHEELVRCPFCPYLEIHTTDACPINFLSCQNPSCNKRSCLICGHTIINETDEANHRTQCVELSSFRKMIDKAIESGSTQRCPDCDLTGIKDDGCTHMSCQRCGTSWCYLCGMREEDCLVDEDADQSFASHNDQWFQHEGRCPMYLVSIKEADDRWPNTDEECLEYFHRYQTLCKLYEVMKIVGEDKLDELNDEFGLIDATGFTIEEIKDCPNQTLINYCTEDE